MARIVLSKFAIPRNRICQQDPQEPLLNPQEAGSLFFVLGLLSGLRNRAGTLGFHSERSGRTPAGPYTPPTALGRSLSDDRSLGFSCVVAKANRLRSGGSLVTCVYVNGQLRRPLF
ncbi:hypothetical protein PGTUg99_033728 [Puccinia graminis f. sp. tritici]|uniref:Uncharacterized protein n=1 Tax=Puccinia graminis f. sp. tritici TaxID=56615 RepID=A0A5B0QUZ1_PUCGR|nr:hypothetical protein PGTUg99_033728 [Puccinia graminis f. sp. tritici]